MIQLLQQPFDVGFTRNPVMYRFRALDGSSNPFRAIGVNSEIRCDSYDGPANDETIVLDWTEPDGTTGSVTFTAKAAPATIDEIPSRTTVLGGSPTYLDWTSYYTAVAEVMKAHPITGPLFIFYTLNRGTGQSLWAEAIDLDDDWTVSFDTSDLANPIFPVFDTATVTANPIPDNYRIVWDVMLETSYRSGGFTKVGSGESFVDANSECYLDLQRILEAEAKNSQDNPPIPTYANTDILVADNLRRYYLRYREEYDGIVAPEWTIGDIKMAMIGGISQSLYAAGDWLATLTATTSLLTWKPNLRKVSKDQREYLAWYNYTGISQPIVLSYQGTRADGTTTVQLFLYEAPYLEALPGETLLIPVGFTQMGRTATDIVSYTVRVVDRTADYEGGTIIYLSPARTYNIDSQYRQAERFLMYLNGFSCPETLRCTGFSSTDLQVQRDDAERILEPGYTTTTRETFQYDQAWQNFFTYRSGYLPRLEVDSLQEMFIGNMAYEIYETAYVPIYIQTKAMPVTETRQLLHSLTFEATPALRQKNYSNVLVESAFVGDAWLKNDSGYWLTIFGQRWALT